MHINIFTITHKIEEVYWKKTELIGQWVIYKNLTLKQINGFGVRKIEKRYSRTIILPTYLQ